MKVTTSKSTLCYGLLYDFGGRNLMPVACFWLSDMLVSFALSQFSYDELYDSLYVYYYIPRRRVPFHDFLRKFHDKQPDELEAISPGFYSDFEYWIANEYLPF